MQQRKSNFELLRIISMFLIVLHHFSVHTEWNFPPGFYSSKLLIQILSIGGKIGVDCFIFISSYFLINRTPHKSALFTIWKTVLFYSVGIFTLIALFSSEKITFISIIKSFLPVMMSTYWFVTAYILLYIFSPFLNIFLKELDKNKYKRLLFIEFFIFSIVGSFNLNNMLTNDFLWFIFIYSIGSYIKLHLNLDKKNKQLCFYFFISLFVTIIFIILFNLLGKYVDPRIGKGIMVLTNTQGVLPLISSSILFVLFINIDIGSRKFINIVASTMFSVYLIHDNFMLRVILWDFVRSITTNNPLNILLIGLLASLIIFILCILIDLTRLKILNVFNRIINR